MKKLLTSLAAVALVACGATAMVPAADIYANGSENAKDMVQNQANDGNSLELMDTVQVIINVILGVVGLIAVVMIIVGGINFVTSQGDAGKVKKARDTILYGVVGLVIALLAFAIVNFVLTNVFG